VKAATVKAARFIMSFLLLAVVLPAGGESLWSPDFKGYLSGSKGLAVGDSLVVQIDASSSLSFSSSSNDSKNLTLEFSGGDSGNIFSFLPQVRTGGTQTTTGKDSLTLKTQIPVVVTAVNPDGTAQVQGSRTVAIQGKNESITVSGAISPGLLDQRGSINFSKLANARLTYTTFLASAKDVLSPADLQRLLTPTPTPAAAASAGAAPAATTAGGAAPAAAATGAPPAGTAAPAAGTAGTAAAGAAGAATAPAQQGLTIPDARKKELLLLYLNRLIDVVFSQ
jgi:flagellar basal body L-ring protein FlgH